MKEHHVALPTLRGLSICAGIGGIDLGLRRALGDAYVTACYIEKEVTAAAVLAARIEDGQLCSAPIWSDLHTFDARPWAGHVDIVTAGIPCQPWSVAGKKRGHLDERHLWAPTYQILKRLQPAFFLLENVPGILADGGLEPIYRDLCEMGYRVEGGFFTAAGLGASHIRKRFFLLAYADGARLRNTSEPLGGCTRREKVQLNFDGTAQSLADANGMRQLQQCEIRERPQQRRPHYGGQECAATTSRHPQSLLGRVVDGLCHGVDEPQWGAEWESDCPRVTSACDGRATRLSMLGNAVVPAVAAHAFATLVRRHAQTLKTSTPWVGQTCLGQDLPEDKGTAFA